MIRSRWWMVGAVSAVAWVAWAAPPAGGGEGPPPTKAGPRMGGKGPMGPMGGMGGPMMHDADKRTPVPLLPMMANHQRENMRDHLAAVSEVLVGLQNRDHVAIEKAAGRLGTTPEMTKMCQHMGAGAPGFTDAALNFHHTADGILDAAKAKDDAAVLRAVNATLATCVSCHATYKQEIVDRDTWEKRTGMKPPGPPAAR